MPTNPLNARRRQTHQPRPIDERGTAASRGYDAHHRRWRKAVLRRDPLCVLHKQRGEIVAATIADHIIPIAIAPERRLDLDNGRGLCRDCHAQVTDNFKRTGVNELP